MSLAFVRTLRRHGETWTMNSWSGSSTDAYKDKLPTGPLSSTFSAIRQKKGDEGQVRDEKGQTRWGNLVLFVDDLLALPATTQDDLPVTLVSPEGREYNLVGIDTSGSPAGSKRLELASGGADASLYL